MKVFLCSKYGTIYPTLLIIDVPVALRATGMPELPGIRPPVWFLGASRLENQTFDRQIFPNNQQLRYRYPAKICP